MIDKGPTVGEIDVDVLAETMSAAQIVRYLEERGVHAKVVDDGLYPNGIQYKTAGAVITLYRPNMRG